MANINNVIIGTYIAIQVVIAIFVSIVGAIHVKRCLNESNQIGIPSDDKTNERQPAKDQKNQPNAIHIDIESKTESTKHQQKGCCKLWIDTVWKMRGVYGGLAVHSFDVLTDILVISQWIKDENVKDDNINPQVMAYSAIAVMIFSKFISSAAIYIKEQNMCRCILQFFDLLIFVEIYETHRKIVCQVKNKKIKAKDKNAVIESTLSFKYIRNFEAIFESIPESVLQLVYVMRTSSIQTIFILSICQSIVSMTNSILNNDYTQMQDDKFAKYKQRFPPTFGFLKHTICRLCEVTYRIGLLALFWTVCGGLPFAILLVVEFTFIFGRLLILLKEIDEVQVDGDTILLIINSLIVVPTEYVYAFGKKPYDTTIINEEKEGGFIEFIELVILNCCCCMCCCGAVVALCTGGQVTFIPLTRIGVSFIQFLILVFWSIIACAVAACDQQFLILFDFHHGLSIFIVSFICYLMYTQYMFLFPNFALPLGVSVRSKFGYAYANELSELQKIKVPLTKMPYRKQLGIKKYPISNEQAFWNEPFEYQNGKPLTAAIIALSKGHHDIVQWLEQKGATGHTDVDIKHFVIPKQNELNGKFGAAFSGNLDGLWKDFEATNKRLQNEWEVKQRIKLINAAWSDRYLYDPEQCNRDYVKRRVYIIKTESDFWDEHVKYSGDDAITPAVYALAKENHVIVKWLEDRGAISHKQMKQSQAKMLLGVEQQ
eukprot:338122_1